jgi:hypothetical protein
MQFAPKRDGEISNFEDQSKGTRTQKAAILILDNKHHIISLLPPFVDKP